MRSRTIFSFALSLAVSAAVAGDTWKLSVPLNTIVDRGENLAGVLVRIGNQVIQAKDFGLQHTEDGRVAIAWLQGYDRLGTSIRIEREIAGAMPLGHAKVTVGTNENGFLVVALGASKTLLSEPAYPCGVSHSHTCGSRSCGIGCGDAPACPCLSGAGGCDQLARDWCDGACEPGSECSDALTDCRCVSPGESPGTTAPTQDPTTDKKKKKPTLQHSDGADGA